MDDASGVSDDEDVGDLFRDPQPGGPVEPVVERKAQVLPLDELQDQPVTLLVFDVVVDSADVRVIELGKDCVSRKKRVFDSACRRCSGWTAFSATRRLSVSSMPT